MHRLRLVAALLFVLMLAPSARATTVTVDAKAADPAVDRLIGDAIPVVIDGGRRLVVENVGRDELRALRSIAEVTVEHPVHAVSVDPMSVDRWAIFDTVSGVNAAWTVTDGTGVTVAVIDSGMSDHPDLEGARWINSAEPIDGVDNDRNGYVDDRFGVSWVGSGEDGHGHGTHVAGIIAARHNGFGVQGVAPGATIMPLRVLDNAGAGNTADVAAAVDYATRMGADIINLSLAGEQESTTLTSAIRRASDAGVLVVMAAGNNGQSLDTRPVYPAVTDAPLAFSVGSASFSRGRRSGFSNYSPTEVAFVGDGERVVSTYRDDGYATMSGTSMAAPMVAGELALIGSRVGGDRAGWLSRAVASAHQVGAGTSRYGAIDVAAAIGAPPAESAANQTTSRFSQISARRTKTRIHVRWNISGADRRAVRVTLRCGRVVRRATTRSDRVIFRRPTGSCRVTLATRGGTTATVARQVR